LEPSFSCHDSWGLTQAIEEVADERHDIA